MQRIVESVLPRPKVFSLVIFFIFWNISKHVGMRWWDVPYSLPYFFSNANLNYSARSWAFFFSHKLSWRPINNLKTFSNVTVQINDLPHNFGTAKMSEETDKKNCLVLSFYFFLHLIICILLLKTMLKELVFLFSLTKVFMLFFFQLKIQLNINNLDRVWLKELCRSENNWHKVVNFEKTISMQF